jgi:2-deoxy-D-gluconate 3-dehydrogenase
MNQTLNNLFSLDGRIALVTGASGGIGAAIAEGLAGAGATVALNGRSEERLDEVSERIVTAGGSCASFAADLAELEAVHGLYNAVIAHYGRIDILVNCAGMNRRQPILEVTPENYDLIMATNLRSIYFLSQRVAAGMREQGGGKIIHVGSLTTTIGLASVSVYGMTKSALGELTKTQAIEWAADNIQVNCLCPGFIATELTVPIWNDPLRSKWILDRLPNKRAGKPADMVGLAVYLAAPASDYTTGQSIYIDGGFTAGSPW